MTSKEQKLRGELLKAAGNATEKSLFARLKACDMLTTCGRCGGSGQYSYNAINGTTCFGCGGAGLVMPKVTPVLVAEVAAIWTPEYLAAYIADVTKRAECKRQVEAARNLFERCAVRKAYYGKEAELIAAGTLKRCDWSENAEYMRANYPELAALFEAAYTLEKKISKIVEPIHNGKVFNKATRTRETANWQEFAALIAPLMIEWEALQAKA